MLDFWALAKECVYRSNGKIYVTEDRKVQKYQSEDTNSFPMGRTTASQIFNVVKTVGETQLSSLEENRKIMIESVNDLHQHIFAQQQEITSLLNQEMNTNTSTGQQIIEEFGRIRNSRMEEDM
jgi:ribosomal protein S15P/S13E